MSRKYTIEFVKDSFGKGGYECTSKKYINNRTKLDYICPNGHLGTITWDNWKADKRCPICAGVKKHTIEFIKSKFEKEGWMCLSNKYINAHKKLYYICPNGHHGSITWNNWQQGKRCPVCAGVKKHTIDNLRLEFEKEGWVLVSEEYVNNNVPLKYICSKGHTGSITWANWSQGIRCPVCAGNKKHTIEFVKSEFEKKGWVCLSNEYIGAHSKLEYICPNGHVGSMKWGHWGQGIGCPKCSMNGTSIWESTVKQFVSTINENFIGNDRTQIINPDTDRYLELDLWFPDLNKAIECNGTYWHSKKDRKDLDKLKQDWCKDNNVSLLIVTDIEWNEDIKKCQTKIENFLN